MTMFVKLLLVCLLCIGLIMGVVYLVKAFR